MADDQIKARLSILAEKLLLLDVVFGHAGGVSHFGAKLFLNQL